VESTPEIKPMLNTRGRHWYWRRFDDGGWCSEKFARLEASREANKIMKDKIYECASASVSVRELIHQVAFTPLNNTLLGK